MLINKLHGYLIQLERIVDHFTAHIMRTELIIEYYASVVIGREVLEDLELSYFGEYHHVFF